MKKQLIALVGANISGSPITLVGEVDWQEIYTLAAAQGVLAMVLDAVALLPPKQQPSKELKMRWIASTMAIERRYNHQRSVSATLAERFAQRGISLYVLKGLALAGYYPRPEHRECGDLDCFLGAEYERGNQVAEELGAKVSRDYYKHSHIHLQKLLIENHQFCVGIRGSRKLKAFERHLESIISKGATNIEDTQLIKPSADFNVLFLTAHAMTHFLVEGIKLRHLCDWALFLKHEQHNINWDEFYYWSDKLGYTLFANTMTAMAVDALGVEITNPDICMDRRYAERIMKDIFKSNNIFNKGYSPWRVRLMTIVGRVSSIWRFHRVYRKSLVGHLLRQAYGFIFEPRPRL